MCIAIFKPAGEFLSEVLLKNCFNNNPDGAGFAYINTDHLGVKRIKMYKSMDFEPFYKQYLRATRIANDSPFLIHFRIKTHGEKDIANCHPFMIDNDTVFIHNGIISGVSRHATMSDTRMFKREILRELPEGWMYNSAIATLIEDFIGASKLAVLNIEGDCTIYNEKKGHWFGKCWMSNDSYKERKVYTQTYYSAKTYNLPATRPNTEAWSINAFTRDLCEYCNEIHQIKDMHAYQDSVADDIMIICDECKKSLEKAGAIHNRMKTTISAYLTQANIKANREKAAASRKAAEDALKTQADDDEAWRDYGHMMQ